jgi:hypothetical protein
MVTGGTGGKSRLVSGLVQKGRLEDAVKPWFDSRRRTPERRCNEDTMDDCW